MPVVFFAAPILSENASRMIAAVVALPGVRVGVISQAPLDDLPPALRSQVAHWRVPDVLHTGQLMDAVTQLEARVGRGDRLLAAVDAAAPGPDRPVLLEEYVTGDEHSFETVSIGGRAVWHSLTHYYPSPLEVLRNPWIQWCLVLPREVEEPQYDDIRSAAFRALGVLGMETGLTHMEWFRRPDGTIAISEVAARPPGA